MPDIASVAITDDTRISRGTSLLVAAVNDEIVMMDTNRGHYYGLDRIGADIWARLEAPVVFGALVDSLAVDYDAERERIAGDVRQLLTIMHRHQVVRLD